MLQRYPAVIIRSLADADAALAPGLPVTLVSERGAALFAGCGWWHELVIKARALHPATPAQDLLDCADAPGQALAAIRLGHPFLVLDRNAPGWEAVADIASARRGQVIPSRPPALDLAQRGAMPRLKGWLQPDDINP